MDQPRDTDAEIWRRIAQLTTLLAHLYLVARIVAAMRGLAADASRDRRGGSENDGGREKAGPEDANGDEMDIWDDGREETERQRFEDAWALLYLGRQNVLFEEDELAGVGEGVGFGEYEGPEAVLHALLAMTRRGEDDGREEEEEEVDEASRWAIRRGGIAAPACPASPDGTFTYGDEADFDVNTGMWSGEDGWESVSSGDELDRLAVKDEEEAVEWDSGAHDPGRRDMRIMSFMTFEEMFPGFCMDENVDDGRTESEDEIGRNEEDGRRMNAAVEDGTEDDETGQSDTPRLYKTSRPILRGGNNIDFDNPYPWLPPCSHNLPALGPLSSVHVRTLRPSTHTGYAQTTAAHAGTWRKQRSEYDR